MVEETGVDEKTNAGWTKKVAWSNIGELIQNIKAFGEPWAPSV